MVNTSDVLALHEDPHSPFDKSRLKERLDRHRMARIIYTHHGQTGPDHVPLHEVTLRLSHKSLPNGFVDFGPRFASTKKDAEYMVAQDANRFLDELRLLQ